MADPGGSSQSTNNIESAVRALLGCLGEERNRRSNVPTQTAVPHFSTGSSSSTPVTVQNEMQRCFPALYSGGHKRKRKTPDPPKKLIVRFTEFQFCLQPANTERTPKDEAALLQAGLGRRTINLSDDACHSEISRVLLEQFPKMQDLQGGWLLKKVSGGSGQRKTVPLPQGSEGYTGKILKRSSNSGKNVIYIVPLQEKIDTEPLPFDALEFEKMPKNICMTCGQLIPLPLIQFHIQSCEDAKDGFQDPLQHMTEHDPDPDPCPICGERFTTDDIAYHASSCGERLPGISCTSTADGYSGVHVVTENSTSPFNMDSSAPSTSATVPTNPPDPRQAKTDDSAWKKILDPAIAADAYRKKMLLDKEDELTLKVKLDIREDAEDQEARIFSFYKSPNTDWARPFQVKLQGDVAIGDGVNRHFFSLVMYKLQHGFTADLERLDYCNAIITSHKLLQVVQNPAARLLFRILKWNCCGTVLFEGQPGHLIPSTSQVLAQNEMFVMAGRIIGHSFLHGGPCLTGVSPSILHVLLSDSPQTATITLEDVADLDIRETITLLSDDKELTEEQRMAVNELALAWDLPVLTKINRIWLYHNLLQHAVLGRNARQLKQLKKGLMESGIWPLLESRPDVISSVFPPESAAECSAEIVLDNIKWPEEGVFSDECSRETTYRLMGYLRQFVSTVSQEHRKELVKFWVGWEIPMSDMKVEVVQDEHPTASTCFRTLRLPRHYSTYHQFSSHLLNCILTNDSGFGLL